MRYGKILSASKVLGWPKDMIFEIKSVDESNGVQFTFENVPCYASADNWEPVDFKLETLKNALADCKHWAEHYAEPCAPRCVDFIIEAVEALLADKRI